MADDEPLQIIRCVNASCGAVLLEADLKEGTIKKKCPKCKTITVITVSKQELKEPAHH